MPLSPPPAAREPIHTRVVECKGYRRSDGLWDIEGHITDRKTYSYTSNERGEVSAGEPVHDMRIRLTVDDSLLVTAIEAVTDTSPYPEVCPSISSAYQQVVGLRIGPGWTRALKERLGGVKGCTHLSELLGPIATTAFQTVIPLKSREERERRQSNQQQEGQAAPFPLLNTCHTFSAAGPVVARYAPHLATKPAEKT
jgi:hypothetical protein